MKIRILPAYIALLIITTGVVYAFSTSRQLTPANTNTRKSGFKITVQDTEHVAQSVHFRIVTPAVSEQDVRWVRASLLLVDGPNQIVSCPLEKKIQADGSIVFEFDVSKRYLLGSKFTYALGAHSDGEPMPAFDANWFYLSDFPPQADAESGESYADTDLSFIYVYGNFNIDLPPHAGDLLSLSPKMLVESTELSFKTAKASRIGVLFNASKPFRVIDKQKEFVRLEGKDDDGRLLNVEIHYVQERTRAIITLKADERGPTKSLAVLEGKLAAKK